MKVPITWLREFVDIELPIPELAHRLTLAGLEVEEIRFVGLPQPEEKIEGHTGRKRSIGTNVTGLAWDPEKFVVGAVLEVMPHPDADRLVLCRLDDGEQEHTVLTGAPNLFPYKGQGTLKNPLKVAYAREGATLFDGHISGWETFTLKRAKIRGVESYSMACSEKELGISEEHEGIIILDEDAPVGQPLVEYMGDAVLDITLTPNVSRNANILGVAREVAALTGAALNEPSYEVPWKGPSIDGRVSIDIRNPELNPRFVLGLVEGVDVGPSPYWVQLRLQLAGMRPINNIVDATNYVMLEIGEPLHAFDFDVLVERAGGNAPEIITRLPESKERITTLDGVERSLDDFTVLVTDSAGALSIAGVMGGAESEVSEKTTRVLLEGASWNFINIRRTAGSQNLQSEASYRFERGVPPAMAERGVKRSLSRIQQFAGGEIAQGLVDEYPLPPEPSIVEISPVDVERSLGIRLEIDAIEEILGRLGFEIENKGEKLHVTTPDHRMDIGEGIVGVADLMEEVARIYGYDRLPETMISDEIPPQYSNTALEREEQIRNLLAGLDLQEIVTYRLTAPDHEARILPTGMKPDDRPYIQLENPISVDRMVMRHSLLASVLEIVESNARFQERIAVFEIGPVYLSAEEGELPVESLKLAIALTGPRALPSWREPSSKEFDFFDLKGILEALFEGLKVGIVEYSPGEHPSFHPGKCARILVDGKQAGVMGELHPLVKERYNFQSFPLLAAELDVEMVIHAIPESIDVELVKAFPPVLEDLAIVVDEAIPAERVLGVIRKAGGDLLEDIRLFDLYRGEQIEADKKSLAYALTYQALDRTLTDEEVAGLRKKIVKALEKELGAYLRS
ncbi:MAG: phenylalanine--tRNA ligase subunit beta [Anaerolineales bacterium]|nr:MAG: phenylalanine--tRNA ligase subunit beta [Anaerolineales bacterium]